MDTEDVRTLCIDTELGQLVAHLSTDPAYPGIYIDLKREGNECMASIAPVECVSDGGDDPERVLSPSIVCKVWGNTIMEDYTHQVICKNLDGYFADSYSGTGTTDELDEDKKLCVNTELGQLIAYLSNDPDYPGIYIDIKRGSMEASAILVEYMKEPELWMSPPSIICRIWGDVMDGNYTDAVACENLDEYFSGGSVTMQNAKRVKWIPMVIQCCHGYLSKLKIDRGTIPGIFHVWELSNDRKNGRLCRYSGKAENHFYGTFLAVDVLPNDGTIEKGESLVLWDKSVYFWEMLCKESNSDLLPPPNKKSSTG